MELKQAHIIINKFSDFFNEKNYLYISEILKKFSEDQEYFSSNDDSELDTDVNRIKISIISEIIDFFQKFIIKTNVKLDCMSKKDCPDLAQFHPFLFSKFKMAVSLEIANEKINELEKKSKK